MSGPHATRPTTPAGQRARRACGCWLWPRRRAPTPWRSAPLRRIAGKYAASYNSRSSTRIREAAMQASASGGPRNSSPGTLNKLFFDAIDRHQKPDALQVKKDGTYQPISSRDLADRVRQVAIGLRELGV